jgi:hypothetical protein
MSYLPPDTSLQSGEVVYPTFEVIAIDGQPVWQVCGGGICVRSRGGHRALELFWAQCRSRGLPVPQ